MHYFSTLDRQFTKLHGIWTTSTLVQQVVPSPEETAIYINSFFGINKYSVTNMHVVLKVKRQQLRKYFVLGVCPTGLLG